ncbi:MAG: hypothetical protein AAB424_01905 [Patescibacteria group bacterium]
MDAVHILRVVEVYEKQLKELSIPPVEHSTNNVLMTPRRGLEHAHWMLSSIREFAQQGAFDTAFRWLGFVQGILWMTGVYSIDELRNHNRST